MILTACCPTPLSQRTSASWCPRVVSAGGSRVGGSYAPRPGHALVGLQRLVSGVPPVPGIEVPRGGVDNACF